MKTKIVCPRCFKSRLKLYFEPLSEDLVKFKYFCKKCGELIDNPYLDV